MLNYAAEQSYTMSCIYYPAQLLVRFSQSCNITPYTEFTIAALLTSLNIQYYCHHNSVTRYRTQLPVPSPHSTTPHSRKQSLHWTATLLHILHSHNNPIMLPPPLLAPCHQHKYNTDHNNATKMLAPTIIAQCYLCFPC